MILSGCFLLDPRLLRGLPCHLSPCSVQILSGDEVMVNTDSHFRCEPCKCRLKDSLTEQECEKVQARNRNCVILAVNHVEQFSVLVLSLMGVDTLDSLATLPRWHWCIYMRYTILFSVAVEVSMSSVSPKQAIPPSWNSEITARLSHSVGMVDHN